jgi:anti-sigma regulatory factor (Ser/Thr protein kinase)
MTDHRLTIEGRFDQVASVGDLVESIARDAGFESRDQYALQLAVCEALENIITHGYQGESTNLIEAQVNANPGEVRIELWDDAPPFNPKNNSNDIEWNEDDPPVGGLGLKIMYKVMDEIRYKRVGDRNFLTMLKRLPPEVTDPGE